MTDFSHAKEDIKSAREDICSHCERCGVIIAFKKTCESSQSDMMMAQQNGYCEIARVGGKEGTLLKNGTFTEKK